MKKKLLLITLATLVLASGLLIGPTRTWAGGTKFYRSTQPVAGEYLVVLSPVTEFVDSTTESLTETYGGKVGFLFEYAFKGYSVTMSEEAAISLSEDSRVEFVEENSLTSIATTVQLNPTYGLDRIDQHALPLSTTYRYEQTGAGVNAYVIDTGIDPGHSEFAPNRAVAAADFAPPDECTYCCRSSMVPPTCDLALDPQENTDCHGHGTHVAGTLGGLTYGVAKGANIFGVKVLNCYGVGTAITMAAGVNWVTGHHQMHPGPAVANMSIIHIGNSVTLDYAVRNSIASGITYVVAAGNFNAPATNYSPQSVGEAILVGATDTNDQRATFSNYGGAIDVNAPGVDVVSAASGTQTGTAIMTGTSMSAPHVAGVAALYLQANPSADPATVQTAIVNNSTPNEIGGLTNGTPNRLLYSGFLLAPQSTYTLFDADAKADTAVWRPSNGTWYIRFTTTGNWTGIAWGSLNDKIVPGDYDGDGKADTAVWRPSDGIWYINGSTGSQSFVQWGTNGDIPAPADFDGDGRFDLVVWRPTTGVWSIRNSSTGLTRYETFGSGSLGDKPVAGDYDGDGKADLAVWRPSSGEWYVLNSSNSALTVTQWGGGSFNDVLVPSDYDGDGKTDVAVWRPGTGVWYIIKSATGTQHIESWGASGDLPVAADYDGDGKTDLAVWRPSNGTWYIIRSSNGAIQHDYWGTNGDVPTPSAYNRY